MVTRIAVVGAVLKWARERSRLTITAAATLVKCDPETLEKYETGAELPNAGTFRRMAEIYLLPEATLLRDTPPADRSLPKDFRSFEGAAVQLDYETVVAIRTVEGRQEALASLAQIDSDVIPPNLPLHSTNENPEKLGTAFRKQLGFTIVDQFRLSPESAFLRCRVLVENLGVSVYIEPMGADDTRGLSIYFNEFPAIVIDQNEKMSGARLFTLFHELAHLLIRQAGISDQRPGNNVEAFCNRFAAAFLMPREAIESAFTAEALKRGEPEIPELQFAADKLCVTISQIAVRLEQLGYAEPGYYRRISSKLKKPTPKVRSDKNKPPFKFTYLSRAGHNLPGIVFASLDRKQITPFEASRLLDLSPAHFNSIKKVIETRRAEAENEER